jgi:hypothetical protein
MTERFDFSSQSIQKYDELLNIQLSRRYSDTGFAQQWQWQAEIRKPFSIVGATIPEKTMSGSDVYVYTDRNWFTRAYCYKNLSTNSIPEYKLYYTELANYSQDLDSFTTWTEIISVWFFPPAWTECIVKFDTVRIPVVNGSTQSFLCTTVNLATAVDRVKRNMTTDQDTNTGYRSWENAIGRILMVHSSTNYIWVYWYITWYDSVENEYITEWTWMIGEPLWPNTLYSIYDTLWDCLRITSPYFTDTYLDWIVYYWELRGIATSSLRKIQAFTTSDTLIRSILFWNAWWTFKWATLYQSKWFPWNPFHYNYTSSNTILSQSITGIYVYRSKMIVYGKEFVYSYSQSGVVEKLSTSIWVKDHAIYETGDDLYFISTDNKIVSVNELTSWTLYIKDITDRFSAYTQTFDNNCFIGADSNNIYFGGCKIESQGFKQKMYMLVFSLDKKFWSVYECPPFKWIFTYRWRAYFTYRWFNTHAFMEMWDKYQNHIESYPLWNNELLYNWQTTLHYTQRIVTNWSNDEWFKEIDEIEYTLENVPYGQSISTVIVKRLAESISTTDKKNIIFNQLNVSWGIGTWVTWLELTGGTNYTIDTLFPRKKYQTYLKDSCLAYKVILESNDTNSFTLSDLKVKYEVNNTVDWRNPTSTY